jgi:DNA-binding NarL/FixJ family response regulator
VILLDLSMPRMNGTEFLEEVRRDADLRRSVVFVLTTSDADEHKVQAYDLGVAGYILKANPANAFLEASALLETYWRVIEFPGA